MFSAGLQLPVRMSASISSQLRLFQAQVNRMRDENRKHFEKQERELSLLSADLDSLIASSSDTKNGHQTKEKPSRLAADLGGGYESKKRARLIEPAEIKSQSKFVKNSDDYVIVYTDGACSGNGYSGARAGIGVWWGDNSPHNLSRTVQGDRHTNNTAEIQAATIAIGQAKSRSIAKLDIHTDSQFLINCITKWMPNWKRNAWMTADKKPVKNKADLLALDQVMADARIVVKWTHVPGHAGVRGNEEADRLAREGAQI